MDRVVGWLDRAQPDVLLMQETKLSDEDAPVLPFRMRGYELAHHGEGRWNGVAIASKLPIEADSIVTNFGDGPVRDSGAGVATNFAEEDFNPFDEARMLSVVIGGTRFASIYAPNGRVVGLSVLHGQARLVRPAEQVAGGDGRRGRAARHRRRFQRCAHAGRRVGREGRPRRDARFAARTRGVCRAARARPRRRVPLQTARTGAIHMVGLPRRQLPQEHGHAHRPPLGQRSHSPSASSGRRSIARHARASPSRRIMHRFSSMSTSPACQIDAGWEGALERIAARTRPPKSKTT